MEKSKISETVENPEEFSGDKDINVTPSGGNASNPQQNNFFVRFLNFFKNVIFELKASVWPSKKETVQYTFIVVLFVSVSMSLLALLDFGLGRLFLEIFGE